MSHASQCELASETDVALLRVVLKVRDGAGGDYWWVECGTCDCAWEVSELRRERRVMMRRRRLGLVDLTVA